MLRNKVLLVFLLVAPAAITWILSGVFEDMMGVYSNTDTVNIAYEVEEGSPYEAYLEQLSKEMSSDQIRISKYNVTKEQVEETVKKQELTAFLYITKDSYIVYEYDKYNTQAHVVENLFTTMFDQLHAAQTLTMVNKTIGYSEILKLDLIPMATSVNYYGIIEIAYFAMCGVVTISIVIRSERKNRITRRMQVAKISGMTMYLAKVIPCSIAVFVDMVGASILSHLLVGNQYGNYTESIGILLLLSIAASAFGILGLYLVKNIAVGIVLIFSSVWFMGFYGGTFQNYMMNVVPDQLRAISPLYYVNRTLVEFQTMGKSDYAVPCVCILVGIVLICSLGNVFLMKREMEE